MKRRLIVAGLVTCMGALAHAAFTPIPLNPSSFNQDVVIEKTAPKILNDVVNATMDGGTNRTGNTFYEVGYNTASPTTGVAVANSIITATINGGTHSYQMPPDYHTNNVIMVGHHNGSRTPIFPVGRLTLKTPAPYTSLSFLTTSGNGPVTVGYVVNYAGTGGSESNIFTSINWFTANANSVYNCAGRVSMGGGVQNVNANPAGLLFAADVLLNNSVANVTSVDFYYAGSGTSGNTNNNGRAVIFGISGSTDFVNFNPIAVTGYNYDAVVEADGPPTTGYSVAASGILTNYVTATLDGGLSKANNVWFEQGYYASLPNIGVPAAGSTVTSKTLPATYTMPGDYTTNCAVLLAANVTNANVIFSTPGSYGALSFLCATANGDTFLPCIISFQDGSTETNAVFVPDWFNRVLPIAYHAFGRVNPNNRTINNSIEQFVDPFSMPPGAYDYRDLALPVCYLFDAVVNVTNTAGVITNVALSFTNGATSTRVASIFAVSGAAPTQVPPVFGYRGTSTPGQPANALVNNITRLKYWEGTNNIVLSVTNIAGTAPITYQWKKAPRGGGLHDSLYSIDYGNFVNMTDGGPVTGSTTSALVISNAMSADSADYLVVASSGGGAVTSLVATVTILSTNQSLLVGQDFGDFIQNYTGDGAPAAESIDHASDQVAQKWLSYSLNNQQLPFVGPVGYTVIPALGSSTCTGLRFFTANDSNGRDPYDYTLEGSNDGGSTWNRLTGGTLKGTLSLPTGRNGTGVTALDALAQNVSEVSFVNATAYKAYRVTITNNYNYTGDTLMQVAEIQLLGTLVPNAPTWVRQPPSSATVYAGGSPNFTVKAKGAPLPGYTWYLGGTAIAGATNATYIFTNAQPADSGKTFYCVATNTLGTITSSSVTLNVIAAPTQPYPMAVIADKAIGYWRLDETPDNLSGNNGVLTHDYMGAVNGYYSNVIVAVQGYNPIADPDTAASFGTFLPAPANNTYVADIKDVSFYKPGRGAGVFSIEAWVNGGSQSVDAAIVSKGYNGILAPGTGTGTEQFTLCVAGTPRKFRFLVRDSTGQGYVAQSPTVPYDPILNLGTWHHLVGVCDQLNGLVSIYVDGLLAGTSSMSKTAGMLNQPMPMVIGSRQSSGATEFDQGWNGVIDDVAVYATALSASQVLNHFYAAQMPPIITLQPTNQIMPENVAVTFSTSAYGAGTVAYQWYNSDGNNPTTPISGQTSSNMTFTTLAAQNQNYYQMVASSAYGRATSAVAQLTVVSGVPSLITPLPANDTFLVGHVMQFMIVAGGTAPFTYQWAKNGVNLNDDYRTYGTKSNILTIGYAAFSDSATYSVTINNAQGSATAQDIVVVTNLVLFNAAAVGWTTNGTTAPIMSDGRLELTSGLGSTARSAFLTAKQNVAAFNYSFIYQTVSGAGGADGVTFCIQNQGAGALGGGGGGLGYSGITPSVALALNIYDPNTRGIRLLQNGTVTTPFTAINPVLIGGNANPVQVTLNYSGTSLVASFKDLVTSSTYNTTMSVDIPGVVGSSSAYVGFTGADGGVSSTQIVTNFAVLPPATSMKLAQVSGNLVITWPAATGAYLLSSPALGPTAAWTQATDTFRVVGNQAQVTVVPGTGARFFRLQLFP